VTAVDDPVASGGAVRVLVNEVSRGHFGTLGIPLVAGRDFTVNDVLGAPAVAIVNQTFARRYWQDRAAVGRRVQLGSDEWVTIVGVARDSKYQALDEAPRPFLYRPFGQATRGRFQGTLLIKTRGEALLSAPVIRSRIADLDPDLAVFNLNALDSRLSLALLPNRTAASLSALLGAIALGLGTIGTYSIMAFLTLQRRREIGIRVALGALPSAVVGMIARQGLTSIGVGLAIGAAGGVGALRFLQRTMYGVSAGDPLPVLLVIALIGASGYLACAIPTRRAAKGDPLRVLRE
jgi:putative ABC transport system permease protein